MGVRDAIRQRWLGGSHDHDEQQEEEEEKGGEVSAGAGIGINKNDDDSNNNSVLSAAPIRKNYAIIKDFLKRRLTTQKEGDDGDRMDTITATQSDINPADAPCDDDHDDAGPVANDDQDQSYSAAAPAAAASVIVQRRNESPQERINRVKRGQMTEDEKQAYLQSVLQGRVSSSSTSKVSSIATPGGQALTSPPQSRGTGGEKRTKSPSLLNEISYRPDQTIADDRKRKEEYFNMVTNPNRFQTFTALQPNKQTTVQPKPLQQLQQSQEDQEMEAEEVVDGAEESPPKQMQQQQQSDLGARLEAAAIENEQRQQEARKLIEEQRLAEQARVAEEMARQKALLRQQEEEALERLRKQEEAERVERERIQLQQKRKQRELEAAQEAYWKKKLNIQMKKRETAAQASQPSSLPLTTSTLSSLEEEEEEEENSSEDGESNDMGTLEEGSPKVSSPVPATAPVPAAVFVPSPLPSRPPVISLSSSSSSEPKPPSASQLKRLEKARLEEEQIAKLKALNSPLPSTPPAGIRPMIATPPRPAPAPPIVAPLPPIASQKEAKDDSSSDDELSPVPRGASIADMKKATASTSAPAPPPKAFGLSSLLGNLSKPEPAPAATPIRQQMPSPSPNKAKTKTEKKGAIRQQIPGLNSDDEDDDGEYSSDLRIGDLKGRTQASSSASPESAKDRAKMFGIDMDKFQ